MKANVLPCTWPRPLDGEDVGPAPATGLPPRRGRCHRTVSASPWSLSRRASPWVRNMNGVDEARGDAGRVCPAARRGPSLVLCGKEIAWPPSCPMAASKGYSGPGELLESIQSEAPASLQTTSRALRFCSARGPAEARDALRGLRSFHPQEVALHMEPPSTLEEQRQPRNRRRGLGRGLRGLGTCPGFCCSIEPVPVPPALAARDRRRRVAARDLGG